MNTKDFYNLINVYLDSVLHPKCIENDMVLQQEGWHYELENKDEPLSLKGVVYNEMKGVYSSPDSLMNTASQMALFPDNAYGVDSGNECYSITYLLIVFYIDCFMDVGKFGNYHTITSFSISVYGDSFLSFPFLSNAL